MNHRIERLLVELLNVSAEIRAVTKYVDATPWLGGAWLDATEHLMLLEQRRVELIDELRGFAGRSDPSAATATTLRWQDASDCS